MSCKVASIRLETNWNDDEWPDVVRVSHVYTPGNVREYVSVVSCRDCKHWIPWAKGTGHEKYECWANGEPFDTGPDGYCKWGERR